jgi:solute carrier family 24 (sodium/potassium/calcium exchanger), member 6
MDCTSAGIWKAHREGSACEYVKEKCSEYEFVNMFYYRFCIVDKSPGFQSALMAITMFVLAMYAFMMLSKIAEGYLTPALTRISEALKLSETISGVTLLAFANGAPDILSVISAGGEEDGIYIAVGNLFGAAMFATTLVIGRCIFKCPQEIVMTPSQWNRDFIFYVIALGMVVGYGIIGNLQVWMSLSFFGLYLIYISVVIYQSMDENRETQEFAVERQDDKEFLKNQLRHNLEAEARLSNFSITGGSDPGVLAKLADKQSTSESVENTNPETTIGKAEEPQIESRAGGGRRGMTITIAEFKSIYVQETEKLEEKEEHTTLSKVIGVVGFPAELFCKLAIPCVEPESLENPWQVLMPFTSSLICLLLTKKWDYKVGPVYIAFIVVPIGISFSLLLWSCYKRKVAARVWILVPFALVTSIVCLKSSAGVVVDSIAYVSRTADINQVLLGATVLAVGNSLADFFANSSLAALGFGVMACTGSIAGQLFNLLIGFGSNTLKITLNKTHVNFNLLDFSVDSSSKIFTLMIVGFLSLYLLFVLGYSYVKDYRLGKELVKVGAIFYCIVYTVFFVSAFFIRS